MLKGEQTEGIHCTKEPTWCKFYRLRRQRCWIRVWALQLTSVGSSSHVRVPQFPPHPYRGLRGHPSQGIVKMNRDAGAPRLTTELRPYCQVVMRTGR